MWQGKKEKIENVEENEKKWKSGTRKIRNVRGKRTERSRGHSTFRKLLMKLFLGLPKWKFLSRKS